MTIKEILATIGLIVLILFTIWVDNQWEVKPTEVHSPIHKN